MCGIVGYTGSVSASRILLDGLSRLEYRGYDSAGIAVRDGNKPAVIIKARGKLKALIEKTDSGRSVKGTVGIGHTRWATHGEASENNAHPHSSDDMNVIGVHNGIMENYTEIRNKLLSMGYTFHSDTDTEVFIKLIDYYYKKYNMGPVDAINKAMVRARGSYALAIMFKDYPDEVWFAKKESPLVVARGSNGCYLASDVPALISYTDMVYYVPDYICGVLKKDSVSFYNLDGTDVTNTLHPMKVAWRKGASDLGSYPHYMIKEIEEQPEAVENTLSSLMQNNQIDFSLQGVPMEEFKDVKDIYLVACGSAYNAASVSEYVMESLTDVRCRVFLASEFCYRKIRSDESSLAIFISQSGETKDTYMALLKAKEEGMKTLAIVNVRESLIAREADFRIVTEAGPEIAVPTTKGYSTELAVMYFFTLELARVKKEIKEEDYKKYFDEIQSLPQKMKAILEDKENIQKLANYFFPLKTVFFIGRGMDYAISLEGALKLKEVTYIPSEAYMAGELKHGPIALVDNQCGVIACSTDSSLYEKTISNMAEVKTRGAFVLAITNYGNYTAEEHSSFQVYVPKTDPLFTPSLAILPLQLLAYYLSVTKGIDPDKPRNLAKSVTVE